MGDSLVSDKLNPEDYPFPLTELDKKVLSQTDEEYGKHSWEELKSIVGRYSMHEGTIHQTPYKHHHRTYE